MNKTVLLVDIQKKDLELIREWRNSKEVSKYMYSDSEISMEDQEKWFTSIHTSESSKYWIIEHDNKQLGVASLNMINKTFNSCYWAFYLGDTSIRNAGIGAKVEFLILDYVFNTLKLNKLRCEVFVFNDKVIKMHEKFGFRREAYYRDHCYKNNAYHDVVGLAILRKEWKLVEEQMRAKLFRDQVS